MKRLATPLVLQVLLMCTLAHAFIQLPEVDIIKRIDRLEFKSCPGCRLSLQPDLKKFLHETVENGKIPGVTVEFIPSHRPELHFIDKDGNTIGGVSVDRVWSVDVEAFVRELGF